VTLLGRIAQSNPSRLISASRIGLLVHAAPVGWATQRSRMDVGTGYGNGSTVSSWWHVIHGGEEATP
jgi:hypothetical protein